MNWTELTIFTSKNGLEPVTGVLIKLGINGFVVEDPDDMKQFIDENSGLWDMVDADVLDLCNVEPNIKIYISDTPQGYELIKQVYSELKELKRADSDSEYGRLEITVNNVKDEDWENNWKAYFKPFSVGKNLVVKPTWEEYENTDNKIILHIDPGNSFGSGLHETTKLCLCALEDNIKSGDTVSDVGCGSGILTVAAAKLGCEKVIGIDIDETAVITARNCVQTNNAEDKAEIVLGDLTDKITQKADIVIGNLFANIIRRLLPDVKRILKPGGLFITSGIITDTLDEVLEAYKENQIEVIKTQNMGDWHLVTGKNPQ